MTAPNLTRDALGDPRTGSFFKVACERVGKAATGLSEEPGAKNLSPVELCTITACACINAAALAIAPLDVEADGFEDLLAQQVAMIRELMCKRMRVRFIGVVRS